MKRWWKRLKCFATGGCRFNDNNLCITHNIENQMYVFRNECVKCGKKIRIEIPEECLFRGIPRRLGDETD